MSSGLSPDPLQWLHATAFWFRKRYLARDIGRMNDTIPGILGLTISIRYFIVRVRAPYAA
ncbi:uncharacterized protein TrAFT101_002898 [Trichoderma asperellum]|uniref:uncharacterized protein n=1 Tax=Trichoderma asperellum TaxID=101201 RepID=UPI00332558C1|nr:hypothetical protein TrAFT101_002898 [Trichoderma asperellum]